MFVCAQYGVNDEQVHASTCVLRSSAALLYFATSTNSRKCKCGLGLPDALIRTARLPGHSLVCTTCASLACGCGVPALEVWIVTNSGELPYVHLDESVQPHSDARWRRSPVTDVPKSIEIRVRPGVPRSYCHES